MLQVIPCPTSAVVHELLLQLMTPFPHEPLLLLLIELTQSVNFASINQIVSTVLTHSLLSNSFNLHHHSITHSLGYTESKAWPTKTTNGPTIVTNRTISIRCPARRTSDCCDMTNQVWRIPSSSTLSPRLATAAANMLYGFAC